MSDVVDEPTLLETIDSLCLKQGKIGNCYLMAVLSALAEGDNPHRIRQMFQTTDYSAEGMYVL